MQFKRPISRLLSSFNDILRALARGRFLFAFSPSPPGGPLLWRVQFALKPASKALGLHGIFIRGMRLKYVIADGAFKRMQVDARAC
jgi:hypothetical protein